ncbi:MAG TPA: flagellar filament capping protein FliD, partial [Thermoguttaceae bacterium]|nr:flagellar filament capping protein FliD [Thermoguttaceae bacterium]
MGRIQTNIGLITGMPIGDTVDSLMQYAGKARDMLSDRTAKIQEEQVAVTELSAYVLAVRLVTDNLGKEDLFDKRQVTSNAPDILSATVNGTPPKGTYQYTSLQTAQNHQMLSSGVASDTESLGGGSFSFRFGSHVERSAPLEIFGGGEGFTRGQIRITDRSGASTLIDLSTAQSLDDVLDAINGSMAINLSAVAHGDGIRLIDHTGQTNSNLKVQELGSGTTAASLGLAGINVDADTADGQDMIRLFEGIDLDQLNDGNGVVRSQALPDMLYTLSDGSSGSINFSATPDGEPVQTLGDLLEVVNSAAPGKLKVGIGPDGDRLVATDLTDGDEVFEFKPAFESDLLADLGLDGGPVDGVITGRRVLGGTSSVLLSSLGGGKGLGTLGALELTDRNGISDTVDLSNAETLEDVIERINAADVGIVAQISSARTGIELLDTTGAQASHMIVGNGDATGTADKLAIAVDTTAAKAESGDMHLQIIAENTLLADLNGGAGVARSSFKIIDSVGRSGVVDLLGSSIETVGDLMRVINDELYANVRAEINETGDGIRIIDEDRAQNGSTLTIEEGSGSTAADLHLLGGAKQVDVDGALTDVIDGSTTYVVDIKQPMSRGTDLASLNGGTGVHMGTFMIMDSDGKVDTLDLSVGEPQSIGNVIDMINQLDTNVLAEIGPNNSIRIRDLADGEGTLKIFEGNGTTASDLHLLHDAETASIIGGTAQVIDGTSDGASSLADLAKMINELGAGVSASTFMDGSNKPFRLSLVSNQSGKASEMIVDTSKIGFKMDETIEAQDAMLVYGAAGAGSSSLIVSSSTNTFRGVLSGADLHINRASNQMVTLTVDQSDVDLVANVQSMVDNYNRYRKRLNELTRYDIDADAKAILAGDATALRMDTDLSGLVSGRFVGAGSIQSLSAIGIDVKKDGTLALDAAKLQSAFAEDPDAVKKFFTTKELGVAAKFEKTIERIAGQDT